MIAHDLTGFTPKLELITIDRLHNGQKSDLQPKAESPWYKAGWLPT